MLIDNNIGDAGAVAIADALKMDTILTTLSLYGIILWCCVIYLLIDNQIGDQGAEAIAEALKVNGVLQQLYLGGTVVVLIYLLIGTQIGGVR